MINYLMQELGFVEMVEETNKFMEVRPVATKSGNHLSEQYMDEYSAFSEFIGRYGRSYASKDEHMGRFDVFTTNYRDVKAHNERFAAGELEWEKAVN